MDTPLTPATSSSTSCETTGSNNSSTFEQCPAHGKTRSSEPKPSNEAGLLYARLEEIGGLRRTPANMESINGAWRNKSFRSYADYMQAEPFAHGIDTLIGLAKETTVAIMCAEAVPWHCHRSLSADALLVRHLIVYDIMSFHIHQTSPPSPRWTANDCGSRSLPRKSSRDQMRVLK